MDITPLLSNSESRYRVTAEDVGIGTSDDDVDGRFGVSRGHGLVVTDDTQTTHG